AVQAAITSTKVWLQYCSSFHAKGFRVKYLRGTSSNHLNKDYAACKPLYSAVRMRNWEKAREIINTGEFSWIDKLNSNGYTPLHLAVGAFKDIQVATDILKEINPEVLATTVDITGMTPAHHAATAGNVDGLKMMADYNPACLFISDDEDLFPIHRAFMIPHINTFLYLFNQMKSYRFEFDKIFEGRSGSVLLGHVIDEGLMGK
nr:hypothetical protein [Tanacetum cinerariifolium]